MRSLALVSLSVALLMAPASAQHAGHDRIAADAEFKTPTVAVGANGSLWRAWVAADRVLVARSADLGRTWTDGVGVNAAAESIDANGEARPKIALGPGGEIYVSYTRLGERPYTGDIRFSRSLDGGKTFSAPRTINDDGLETGHRFDTLAVAPDGTVFLVWIDKRDLERALTANEAYAGAALYYTTSRDRGASFAANRKIKDHVCECCRIAHAFDDRGRLTLVWRDVMPGSVRDHASVRLTAAGAPGPIERITADEWAIEGCPHHGPGLAIGSAGTMHLVWFTGEGPRGPGAFYGRVRPDATRAAAPLRLGPATQTIGHAAVHANARRVAVAWKERRKPGAAVMLMESTDGGATFAPPRAIATTRGASDHPFLVETSRGLLLSWLSDPEGHRIVPIENGARQSLPGRRPATPPPARAPGRAAPPGAPVRNSPPARPTQARHRPERTSPCWCDRCR
jgi:hypothetical protein